MIVQLDKGDALGVAIKLFVLSLVSHTCNLRVRVDNQNLELREFNRLSISRAHSRAYIFRG